MHGPERSPSQQALLKAFGAAMRLRRKHMELTQEQVAEHADLHTNYVSSIERGERNVSLHNIARIAAALQMKPSDLVAAIDRLPLDD